MTAEEITPEQKEKLKLNRFEQDLFYFLKAVTPTFEYPFHLKPVINQLNSILRGNKKLLLISAPPRHGKTVAIQHFLAMYLNKYQDRNILYCGYGQDFASTKSMLFDEYATKLGIPFNPKMNNKGLKLTTSGGGLYISGINGSIEGTGYNLIVVDDPIKNVAEAESKTYRDKTWNWFENSLETRFEPDASVIVMMHRWHEDDLASRIAKNRDYECIRIPALCDNLDYLGKKEQPDLLGREFDAPLWRERYNYETLSAMRKEKPITFLNQYQGLPRRKEDKIFQGVFYYSELPKDNYTYGIGCDLAYSSNTRADYSVAVVSLKHKTTGLKYIIDVQRWQKDITYTKQILRSLEAKYKTKLRLENNGPQKAVYDMLKADGIRVEGFNPVTDKYTRSQPLAEEWNAGNILLPDPTVFNNDWLNDYIEEILEFTGIKDINDDQVDATVLSTQFYKDSRVYNWNEI